MNKRVYCLYRVSTKGQVEKDDIPMQRQRCHEFVAQQGWTIVREFSEKGVSGYKISAKDRDAIQEIQKDAAMDKFDILLVFMFDRLGRREDETPFIVEWFVKNGIEVWSAEEGQQRFDSHVDKLMNYIRYWQASGESLKTSIRTKTRLAQIVQEGRFRGGVAPYGYRLVKKGRLGKKNKELYDIEINPDEAIAIQEMFNLADRFGYGGRRISSELKAKGIVNLRTGEPFHYATIQRILQNIMYMGILRSGETRSEIFEELQIITPEQFYRVRTGVEQRAIDYEKKCGEAWSQTIRLADGSETTVERPPRIYPKRNNGKTLLSGNVYCGHCGGRIFTTSTRKSHHPSPIGSPVEHIPIYKCYNRTQHKQLCNGPSTYRAEKVDSVIDELLRNIFDKAKAINQRELFRQQVQAASSQYQQRLKKAKAEYTKYTRELGKWESLMLDSIEGTCVFSPEQIKSRMDVVKEKTDELSVEIETLQESILDTDAIESDFMEQHQRLLTWADMYADALPEEKRMVASYVIKAVTLTREYGIQVEFNISEAQYLGGMEMS